MRLWLARDENGGLYLFQLKPKRVGGYWDNEVEDFGYTECIELNPKYFKYVTWENSPVEFDLVEVNPITEELKKELEEFDGQPNTLARRDRMTEIINFYNQKDFTENGYQSIVRKIEFNDDGTYHIIAKRI